MVKKYVNLNFSKKMTRLFHYVRPLFLGWDRVKTFEAATEERKENLG